MPVVMPNIIVILVRILLSLNDKITEHIKVDNSNKNTINNPIEKSHISFPNVSSKKLYVALLFPTFRYTVGNSKNTKPNKYKK